MVTFASGAAGLMAFPPMTAVAGAVLRMVAPSLLAGPACMIGGILLSSQPNEWLRKSVFRGLRELRNLDRNIRRMEFGGRYEDTETAQAMRMAAVHEMNAAHQAGRTYLGQCEALLMHR